MKKILAFDLDDTLAVTKSPISDEMATVLSEVLENYDICIISGGKYELFQKQVISRLNVDVDKLKRLHLMPTCGTRYYRFDESINDWVLQYAEDLTDDEKTKIKIVLEEAAKQTGYWPDDSVGQVIEDRDSQITYSGLGQGASPEAKYAWDPTGEKRMAIRAVALEKIPELEIRLGGTTSIDVTRKGIDKAYGMQKLIDATGVTKDEILFFGDKLQEGGNDYPVKAFGIDSVEVTSWQDTAEQLQSLLTTAK